MLCKDVSAIKLLTDLFRRDGNVRREFPQRSENIRVLMCPGDSMFRGAVMHQLQRLHSPELISNLYTQIEEALGMRGRHQRRVQSKCAGTSEG